MKPRKSSAAAIVATMTPSKPSFQIHEDPDAPDITPLKKCGSTETKVLTVKKVTEDHEVPLAIFEAPDPTKRPMYCKHLVYQGNNKALFHAVMRCLSEGGLTQYSCVL